MSNSNNEQWYPLNLPSKCLTYGDVDKLKITIRPLKGKDEKSWFELIVQNLPSESEDLAWNKYLQIEDVRNNVYFTRIMEENENGFIYELVPRDKPTYHFRYVIVQGSQLYVISTALGSELTMEQTRELFEAVIQ